MSVRHKIQNGIGDGFVRRQHLDHNGILREFIWLEKRDHHLIFRARIIGDTKGEKINDADE
jgi:hypothetical protein